MFKQYPETHCICCKKMLTNKEHPTAYGWLKGGTVQIDCGYGSGFDDVDGIVGFICDGCITERRGLLFHQLNKYNEVTDTVFYSTRNMRPFREHPEAKGLFGKLEKEGK